MIFSDIQNHLNFFHMFICSQKCNSYIKYQKSMEGAGFLPYVSYIGMSCGIGYGLYAFQSLNGLAVLSAWIVVSKWFLLLEIILEVLAKQFVQELLFSGVKYCPSPMGRGYIREGTLIRFWQKENMVFTSLIFAIVGMLAAFNVISRRVLPQPPEIWL